MKAQLLLEWGRIITNKCLLFQAYDLLVLEQYKVFNSEFQTIWKGCQT